VNRKAYSKVYNEHKQLLQEVMRNAVNDFACENPERFAELQAQAKYEIEHPHERPVTRTVPLRRFDTDTFIRQHHTQDYYIHTKDCFGDTHLYFESLDGEVAEDVLKRRHPKFSERNEAVIEIQRCQCPLCQNLN